MNTLPTTTRNHRALKRTTLLSVLLIAPTLVASFQSRFTATANSTTTESTIVLDTDSAPLINGTVQTVSNASVIETDPHVSGNLATYTFDPALANSRVHYQDLSTGTDNVLPGDEWAFVSGVSGSRIAYTVSPSGRYAVRIFDTNSQTTTAVPGVNRVGPSIGGNLVAFEDWGNGQFDIATYDLSTGIVTPLTNDSLYDQGPKVSPNGKAVVWEKCQTSNDGCDIYAAIQTAPGVFTTRALTTGGGEDRFPSTNGEVAVYVSDRTGDRDIYYQPLTGGTEVHLSILGTQRHPTISGHLISFESGDLTRCDIYIYDIRTGTLSRATNTPHFEMLSEISVSKGVGRIVYVDVNQEDLSFDIYAVSFQAPRETEDEINDLISLIRSFNLPPGAANNLITKLQNALDAIEVSDTATACSSLTAFTNVCAAQSGKKLTTDQATQLINAANQIKSDLGCQ
ncbi:MAG TPA: hypothetical protein VL866_22740 [Pyrinomonadaceae bacterium]|nr:hypothetical protein [Pyrinomonadaceae bacterium]